MSKKKSEENKQRLRYLDDQIVKLNMYIGQGFKRQSELRKVVEERKNLRGRC